MGSYLGVWPPGLQGAPGFRGRPPPLPPAPIGVVFTSVMRASTAMAPQLLGRLIGLILGDGYIGRTRPTWNAIFPFQLSLKRFPYFWQVFSLLCHFCQSFAWYAKEQP